VLLKEKVLNDFTVLEQKRLIEDLEQRRVPSEE